jgi:uncharacterized membrane protein YhhN
MTNKILGALIFIIAIAGMVFGIALIPQLGEYGWPVFLVSVFLVLVAVIVFRKGLRGAVTSINDGTPKEFR